MRFRVTQDHERSFELAPRVASGERVEFVREDKESPGWFFGRAGDGTEGYFPTAWFELEPEAGHARARRDYDAMELTLRAGGVVEALEEVAGWRLVRAADGAVGWIPIANTEAMP